MLSPPRSINRAGVRRVGNSRDDAAVLWQSYVRGVGGERKSRRTRRRFLPRGLAEIFTSMPSPRMRPHRFWLGRRDHGETFGGGLLVACRDASKFMGVTMLRAGLAIVAVTSRSSPGYDTKTSMIEHSRARMGADRVAQMS
jgi:hypothetical protein